jgi:integrase
MKKKTVIDLRGAPVLRDEGEAPGQKVVMEKKDSRSVKGIFEKVPGSGVWWVRHADAAGRYRREKAGTLNAAITLYAKRKTQALEGKKLPEKLRCIPVTFAEIACDALIYSQNHKRSYRSDQGIKNKLVEWFGAIHADALSGNEMEQRLAAEARSRKWAASTFNHYRSFLMLAYREAKRSGKVQSNPARDIRHRKENNSRVRYLSRGSGNEYERLYRVIERDYPEHLAEFVFGLNTGLRLGSQYSATHEMIDWTRGVLDIPRTKNGEAAHIHLNQAAKEAIWSLPSWRERKGPLFRNLRHPEKAVRSNDHWFKPALKKAGIEKFRWHDLRHVFATWLIQHGVPLERVAKLLGHKNLSMTMRYAHLAPSQLHDDVERLATDTRIAPSPNEVGSGQAKSLIN